MRLVAEAADSIERTLAAVDATCDSSIWTGPAADRYRDEWTRHRTAIRTALDDARAQTEAILARTSQSSGDAAL